MVKGRRQNFFDPFDRNDRQFIANFLRHLFQVLLVGLRENDPPDAGAMGGQHLLLDPADR